MMFLSWSKCETHIFQTHLLGVSPNQTHVVLDFWDLTYFKTRLWTHDTRHVPRVFHHVIGLAGVVDDFRH